MIWATGRWTCPARGALVSLEEEDGGEGVLRSSGREGERWAGGSSFFGLVVLLWLSLLVLVLLWLFQGAPSSIPPDVPIHMDDDDDDDAYY